MNMRALFITRIVMVFLDGFGPATDTEDVVTTGTALLSSSES